MGTVYIAEDTSLERRVAIKFLTATDEHYRARFLGEARALSSFSHPNIATVHDYGETDDGQPFIVMELVSGLTLADILRQQGLTLAQSVDTAISIAEALGRSSPARHRSPRHKTRKCDRERSGARSKSSISDWRNKSMKSPPALIPQAPQRGSTLPRRARKVRS